MALKTQSQLSLLLSYPFLLTKLHSYRENLSRDFESIIQAVVCSGVVKQQVCQTQQHLKEGPPKLGPKEQAALDSLDMIIEGSTPQKCKELAEQVAEYMSLDLSQVAFADQLAEVKKNIGKAEIFDDTIFPKYLHNCVKVLEKGLAFQEEPAACDDDILSDPTMPPSSEGHIKEVFAPTPPLSSFICPITRQVMKDPVQVSSGQTYERSAIEQWFEGGETTCPLGVKLKNTKVKPNHALRQSISEWRERNYVVRLHIAESRLRSSQPNQQLRGARDIIAVCEEDPVNKNEASSRKMIPLLIQLANHPDTSSTLREHCFNALAALAHGHQENQDTLVCEGVMNVLVRSLRNYDEAEPAIKLLKILSSTPKTAEMICRMPDAVLLLVTFLGHEKEELVISVKSVLVNLPTTDKIVVHMAEANLLIPLATRLVEGEKESKILMAKTLARLKHMPESSKILASSQDTITALTNMTKSRDADEVNAAIGALENLSKAPRVGTVISACSGLEVLVKLLTSQASVETKITASRVVANVLAAVGDEWPQSEDRDADIDNYLDTFIMLISSSARPTTNALVQSHLLQGLFSLVKGRDTGEVTREMLLRRNVFSVLTPHFKDSRLETRRDSLRLVSSLSRKHGAEAWLAISIQCGTLKFLVDMLSAEEITENEELDAARIISHLPAEDQNLTITLAQQFNIVPHLVHHLSSKNQSLQEACLGALVRFTTPETLDLQKQLADMGVIPALVAFLDSRRPRTKIHAAQALANFSRSSSRLIRPVAPNKCWQCFAPTPITCNLHGSLCSVKSTYCLLEAEAIPPLVTIVAEDKEKVAEAALEALYTLVEDERHSERGCNVLHQANALRTIISKLPNGTPRSQEISICICEKFLGIPHYQHALGASAQMHIIAIAQQAPPSRTKEIAGKILNQLELLGSLVGSNSNIFQQSSVSAS